MALTLNQAAKICSRSKSTLLDAIRSGRMSAPKDDRGRYVIDPAELHRAFPFQSQNRSPDQSPKPQPTRLENQPEPADPALKREIELLREMLGKAEANADHWRTLAERQQALLEDKRPKEPRSLFQRLFKR
ncbi:BTB/POZ domain-containing protein [Paracoccus beibuensis]|uniref:hypothetical protein n=1 Tax=Paracoccus beibuensis TaxID=547602 RepID=UPI0022405DAE|nr:hypothetical protein [Paracoccus beibuensis]